MGIISSLDLNGKPLTKHFRLIGTRYYTGTDFLSSSQGITNDGEFYYCVGTFVPLKYNGLSKIDMKTGEVVLKKVRYLPDELASHDFNHYGGCTYFDGKIYVAVEDKDRAHPCIGVFSAQTLEYIGKSEDLPGEIQPNGNLPWVAADKENGLLYTGYFYDCDFINVFDIGTLDFIKHIPINRILQHTQGAEMFDGKIYVSCHDSWRKKHIYSINPETGGVRMVMERDASKAVIESEGMTICPMEDGSFFHQLDVIYPSTLAIRRYSNSF